MAREGTKSKQQNCLSSSMAHGRSGQLLEADKTVPCQCFSKNSVENFTVSEAEIV